MIGIPSAFSSWLKGAQSAVASGIKTAQTIGATLQAQTITALSTAQRAVTQPFQPQPQAPQQLSSAPYTVRTITPVDALVQTVAGGAGAVQSAIRSTQAAARVVPVAAATTAAQIVNARAPIIQGVQRDIGQGIQRASQVVGSAQAAVQGVASSPAAQLAAGAGIRGIAATPTGGPATVARAASGGVRVAQDAIGFSAAVDQYKARDSAFQKTYATQQPLYDRYVRNVQSYESSRAAYDKLSQHYAQRVQAYQANPSRTGLAELRMLEANLQMLGAPLQARYEQIRAQDRALTPLWQQAEATEAARKDAEVLQARRYNQVSSAVIDALGAARMGSRPPASRQTSMRSEQALLYGAYPAAVGAAEKWKTGVVEPFEREATKLTGGRPLVISAGTLNVVRNPIVRGGITALAPSMASTPLAMDLVVGAKQWAGHESDLNLTRFATGIVRSPADAAEMIGMAIPGTEMAARRVVERPSDLIYLPVAGMVYMGAGTAEAFKQDPEGTAGSLVGMAALSRGAAKVSSVPLGRTAKAVRPRIVEARISSMLDPVDRPAFHAVSTIGRGIEGIRSDVLTDPRFGEVLNVGAERAPILTNILASTPHSVYGSATRTGQMRPGTVMRQAKDVDVFVPDVDLLNTRIAQEFGRSYSVEGSTVVRDIPGQGRVHAIDTHVIPEGYPLPGAGKGVRIQYEDPKVAPELPFEWMPKDLLRAGKITQEYLHTQVQRKAASVAGEPADGGGWRFGPPEHRAGKDVFDLISDSEYLISVEEGRLPGMDPVRRALVARRLQRLKKAVEELKKNPKLSVAYRQELQKAKTSLEKVASPEDDILLRVSSMPAPRRSPAIEAPSPLVFPEATALISADPGWIQNLSRPPSPMRGSPRTSGVRSPAPSRSPARMAAQPSRSPSMIAAGSVSPIIAGGGVSPILGGASPSVVSSPSTGRTAQKRSTAPVTGRGSPSQVSPGVLAPSPYLYEPGPGVRTIIPSPSPLIWPAPQRPPVPQERRSRRKREEEEEARRRRRKPGGAAHWELGPAPGISEMAGMIFGGGAPRRQGSILDFGPPSIGAAGLSGNRPARAGEMKKKGGKAGKKKK